MSEYVRITDRKIEMTDEGVEALMSDYTPTTEDARREYAIAREGIEPPDEVVAQFDRWLAEVKAQVWDDAWKEGSEYPKENFNPYRQGEN